VLQLGLVLILREIDHWLVIRRGLRSDCRVRKDLGIIVRGLSTLVAVHPLHFLLLLKQIRLILKELWDTLVELYLQVNIYWCNLIFSRLGFLSCDKCLSILNCKETLIELCLIIILQAHRRYV
jgi:hypothetical protein